MNFPYFIPKLLQEGIELGLARSGAIERSKAKEQSKLKPKIGIEAPSPSLS